MRGEAGLHVLALTTALGFGTFSSLLSLYLDALGMSGLHIGLMNSASMAVAALASWAAGSLSASRGYPRVMAAALALPAVLSVLSPAAMRVEAAVLLVLAVGAADGAFRTSSAGLLSEVSRRVGPSFGAFYTLRVLGMTASGALAGLLAEAGYEYMVLASCLFYAVSVPLALSLPGRAPEGGGRPPRSVRLLALALFLHTMGFAATRPFIPLYPAKVLGMRESQVGALVSVRSLGVLSSQAAAGYAVSLLGPGAVLTAHVALSSLAWGAYPLARDFLSASGLFFAAGVVAALDMPARRALVAQMTEPGGERARGMGEVDLVTGMASAIGFLLGGIFWDSMGPEWAFWAPALINLAAAPLVLLASRTR